MNNDYSSGASWNSASIAGLVLASVTIVTQLGNELCGKIPGFAGGVSTFLAWAAKLILCAVTFRILMKNFHEKYSDVDYRRLQHYGLKLALFSSIIVTGYTLIDSLIIHPDTINQAIEGFRQGYSSMLDSNAEAALDKLQPKLPVYIGVMMMAYCFLWGWIYSTIFAKNIAPTDPFSDTKAPENR